MTSICGTFYDLLTSKPPFYQGELSIKSPWRDAWELGRFRIRIDGRLQSVPTAAAVDGDHPYWIESGLEADPDAPHGTASLATGWTRPNGWRIKSRLATAQ